MKHFQAETCYCGYIQEHSWTWTFDLQTWSHVVRCSLESQYHFIFIHQISFNLTTIVTYLCPPISADVCMYSCKLTACLTLACLIPIFLLSFFFAVFLYPCPSLLFSQSDWGNGCGKWRGTIFPGHNSCQTPHSTQWGGRGGWDGEEGSVVQSKLSDLIQHSSSAHGPQPLPLCFVSM